MQTYFKGSREHASPIKLEKMNDLMNLNSDSSDDDRLLSSG